MDPMIWVVDDDNSIRFVFEKALSVNHIHFRIFESGDAALEAMKEEHPDVIITDIRMPGTDGLQLINEVHKIDENIPVIIMTAHSDLTAAIDSYESGTFEYLPKPFDVDQAIAVIRRAAVHRVNMLRLASEKNSLQNQNQAVTDDAEIIGKSPAMQEVFKCIGRISKTQLPVLIHGEVGTGRSLVAATLHNHSNRSHKRFVALNMSSMPQESIQTEIFGDARLDINNSALMQAQGGTLFINEICDMPMEAQTRMLQVLESHEFLPVGGSEPIKVDVRVLAATSQDLEQKIAEGTFVSDLYYRLNVINVNMPPLRNRNNDIPMLAKHFLAQAALENRTEPKKLTSEVLVFLCRQSWPGNVRQLKNLCKYLTIMVTGRDIQLVDLPSEFLHANGGQIKTSTSINGASRDNTSWQELLRNWVDGRLKAGEHDILAEAVPEFERVMLEATLAFTGNHKQESARLLGWGRNTLTRKIKDLNLK